MHGYISSRSFVLAQYDQNGQVRLVGPDNPLVVMISSNTSSSQSQQLQPVQDTIVEGKIVDLYNLLLSGIPVTGAFYPSNQTVTDALVEQRLQQLLALFPGSLGSGGGIKIDGSGTAIPISESHLTNLDITLTAAMRLLQGSDLRSLTDVYNLLSGNVKVQVQGSALGTDASLQSIISSLATTNTNLSTLISAMNTANNTASGATHQLKNITFSYTSVLGQTFVTIPGVSGKQTKIFGIDITSATASLSVTFMDGATAIVGPRSFALNQTYIRNSDIPTFLHTLGVGDDFKIQIGIGTFTGDIQYVQE